MKNSYTIIGGGVIGLSLSIALAKRGNKVNIVEKNANSNIKNNRFYSLSGKTKKYLESINIWENIDSVCPIKNMSIYFREISDKNIISFSPSMSNKNVCYIMKSSNLWNSLHCHINDYDNINFYDNSTLVDCSQSRDKVSIKLDSGLDFDTNFLFACDGINSSVKDFSNVTEKKYDYSSVAITFNVSHSLNNDRSAAQVFLESGPIAFLPIDEFSASIVVSIKKSYLKSTNYNENDALSSLKRTFGNMYGDFSLISKIYKFDLFGSETNLYQNDRVILVGDSAHSIHPLAGMGLNIGYSDIMKIIECLDNRIYDYDDKRLFYKYARDQAVINKRARITLEHIEKLFSSKKKFIHHLIHTGMYLTNSSNFIKREIMNYANHNLDFG